MKTIRALLASVMALAVVTLSGASCGEGATMPSLEGASGWINSPPLDARALRGKVVVVDFWTYTCINWRRTAPWLRHWATKYKDAGLVVIGVHSPEFAFEQDPARVRRLTAAMHIGYPVAIDSRLAIWRAFRNEYWPALYVVDAQGRIRHRQFGEGDYDKAEAEIQALLKEAGAKDIDKAIAPVTGAGPEAAADWTHLESQETYVGRARAERFASPGGISESRHVYSAPGRLRVNEWALAGDWTVTYEAARSNVDDAHVRYRFHARDLHVVMGSAGGVPVRIRVRIDGKPPGTAHGTDIDADGVGTVSEYRMYQLIRQPAPVEERELDIQFLDRGAELFAFTFG